MKYKGETDISYRVIDAHCDTLNLIARGIVDMESRYNHVSIDGLKRGNIGIQFFAAWIDPRKNISSYLQHGLHLIQSYYKMLERYDDEFIPILNYKDAKLALNSNKTGCLLTVEGGNILQGDITNLDMIYNLGVRLLTLTWNHTNEIASGVGDAEIADNGLTEFGGKVVSRMNKLGMIIDVSHISNKSFWQVCELSNMPIVASHSNARSICDHIRNLDNDQIKAIADSNGIIGINFYPPFLTDGAKADIDDILRHIDYIAGLIGIDYIGFGSDFDGIDSLPRGIDGSQSFENIIDALLRLNYSEEEVQKICNGNMMRVLRSSL